MTGSNPFLAMASGLTWENTETDRENLIRAVLPTGKTKSQSYAMFIDLF